MHDNPEPSVWVLTDGKAGDDATDTPPSSSTAEPTP